MRKLSLIFFSLVAASTIAADDAPRQQMLYGTLENHSLEAECSIRGDGLLECQFTQIVVRKEATSAELQKELDAAKKEFKKDSVTAEECKNYKELLEVVEGKRAAPEPEVFARLTNVQRRDTATLIRAFIALCATPSEANYLAIVRLGHTKKTRTCLVSSQKFNQTFTRVTDSAGRNSWVVQSKPSGSCGIVQLSRFESEDSSIGTAKFTFWKYFSRKAITNPKGEIFAGASCSKLDEREYLYDWRSREIQAGCDYIKFSVF